MKYEVTLDWSKEDDAFTAEVPIGRRLMFAQVHS